MTKSATEKVAECTNCGERITFNDIKSAWYYDITGKQTCTKICFAVPRRGTQKREPEC